MKLRIYADTSVLGGCLDEEFSTLSKRLIGEFRQGVKILAISDLTLREIENAPEEVHHVLNTIPEVHKNYLSLDEESKLLAQQYIQDGAISPKYIVDAQHIAIATIARVDVLVSWNFQHIVNLRRIHLYNATNLKRGYPILEIRSPREIIDEEKR